jgi:hypothetical protein
MKQQKIVEKTKYAYEENDCPCICHDGDFTEDCMALCEGCFKYPEELQEIVEKGKTKFEKEFDKRMKSKRFQKNYKKFSKEFDDLRQVGKKAV